jgi:hypothetical protein
MGRNMIHTVVASPPNWTDGTAGLAWSEEHDKAVQRSEAI